MSNLTKLQQYMANMARNIPLTRDVVQSLPKGFHPTAVFETKRQRSERKNREKILLGRAKRKQYVWTFDKSTGKWSHKIIHHF